MRDDLLPYYNRELSYIRRLGAEFAEQNPKIAGRLRIGADMVEDPHVARLIEAFAYVNARTRKKLDDDFPELTHALFEVLYPHYLAPVPSMAIVQFTGAPDLASAYELPRGTMLETEQVDGDACRFRTAYDVTILPIEVESAKLSGRPLVAPPVPGSSRAVASLRLVLDCRADGVTFPALAPKRLRFYLRGPSQQALELYELILNDAVGVAIARAPDDPEPFFLRENSIVPVGFGADEGMLPYPPQSFLGYQFLTEYFTFPQKFLFFDIEVPPHAFARMTRRAEVFVYLRRSAEELAQQVSKESFALGCTPVVNLYRQRAEPVALTHTQTEYRVVPDARRPLATEVYSVDRVAAVSRDGEEERYEPLFSVRHATHAAARNRFWHLRRRGAARHRGLQIPGSDAFLALVDPTLQPSRPADWTLSVETTCLNRDLPARLPFGGDQPRLQLAAGQAPLQRIRCLTKPTPTLRPPLEHGALWRLVSHLALNHVSITGGEAGTEALREILKLYDFRDSAETRATIDGVAAVASRHAVGRAPSRRGGGICRGVEVRIEFDPDRFTGGGVFLFASVLERFLALYASINSFVQTVASVRGREGELRRWSPRAGETVLL